jgi:FKBP-type peptidyl-prolyl cis-trans isomerase SlpA
MKTVKQNDNIKVHYTGKLSNGQVFDSSKEREPLAFKVGEGQIIPGFEKAVVGMELNETKEITIQPDNAYGEVRDDLIQEVPKDSLPDDLKPEVGQQLISKLPDGREVPIIVTEIKDNSIMVDANHPLAGQELNFEIEVVEINE